MKLRTYKKYLRIKGVLPNMREVRELNMQMKTAHIIDLMQGLKYIIDEESDKQLARELNKDEFHPWTMTSQYDDIFYLSSLKCDDPIQGGTWKLFNPTVFRRFHIRPEQIRRHPSLFKC